MATRNIVPRANNEGGIGTLLKQWATGFIKILNGITITGGTNTFNFTNGSASLDVAAGSAIDVNANLTVNNALTTPNITAAGQIPYGSAANVLSSLAAGLDGQALISKAAAAPEWNYNIQEITELCSVD